MASSDQKVVDGNGTEISVGTRVMFGDPLPTDDRKDYLATVTEIGEHDVDYDDDLGRARLFPPMVKWRFDNGDEDGTSTYDVTPISWADYPDGPDVRVFSADDLEVVP